MKTNSISAIVSGTGVVSAVVNGKSYSIQPDSVYYNKVRKALKSRDAKSLIRYFDLDSALRVESNGKVTFTDGKVMYQGTELSNGITERIVQLFKLDFPFEPMLKFLENVLKNPSEDSVKDLYGFLDKNSLPITEDGYFLAWKYVREDFKDNYSGTLDNSPGKTVSMPREKVNPNRNETCSHGLHVCSHSYLSHLYGKVVVLVKVHPADVVAVPNDYNNAKMRVCKYLVLQQVDDHAEQDKAFADNPVYSTDVSDYGEKPTGQRFWSVRDPNTGRWTKKEVE